MAYLVLKSFISGIIVLLISEVAKRNAAFGALVASLPVVSVLGMIWLWQETKDSKRLALHSEATFWLVLPSLPMFLILPRLLNAGINFYFALAICCVITALLYVGTTYLLPKIGIKF